MDAMKRFSAKTLSAAFAGALAVCAPVALTPVALTLSATPVAAQNNATINRAVRAIRAITTMQAEFTQADRNGQVVGGTLTLRNPGHIRFEYSDDVNMLVVSNGRTLTFVDYDVRQKEQWPISDSPLAALLDPDRDVARLGRLMPTNSSSVVSISVTDPDRPEYGEITLIFVENPSAPGGLELVSWVALDSQNVRTTIRLRGHRYGMTVPDSTFTYREPRPSTRRPG